MKRQAALVAIAIAILAAGCGNKGGEQDAGDADADDAGVDTAGDDGDVPGDDDGDGDAADAPDTPGDTGGEDAADATDTPDAEEDAAPDCTPGGVGAEPAQDLDACLRAVQCVTLPGDMAGSEAMALCLFWPMFRESASPFGDMMRILVVDFYMMVFDEVIANASCVSAAADCDGVLRCLNGGTDSGSCTLPFPGVPAWGASCSGGVLETCQGTEPGVATSGRIYQHDCADEGLECVETTLGAGCMRTDCGTAGEPRCDGDVLDYCVQPGAHIVVDCHGESSGADGTCGDTDPSTVEVEAGCVPAGDACDPSTAVSYCTGDVQYECDADWSRWIGVNCADLGAGWGCDTVGGEGRCMPDTTSWTCTLPPDPSCDCDDMVSCDVFAAEDVRLHCPDYGFETCGDADPSTVEIEPGCI